MSQQPSNVPTALYAALQRLQKSPDLTPEEVERLKELTARLITEFSLLHTEKDDEGVAA